jgi:4-diphosphocytidyl-2-C-methyl-D-erythritol kinase
VTYAAELWNRTPPSSSGICRLRVRAPAKLNLFLEIVRRRPDGYHDLETVFQEISLADELSVSYDPKGSGVVFRCRSRHLADVKPGHNLAERAAHSFSEAFAVPGGFTIELKKNSPVGAGLGGGSSDAAATLLSCAWLSGRLKSTHSVRKKLADLAKRLGSDVPFFLRGGTCIGKGLGEKLEPLCTPDAYFALVFPGFPVSTAEVYKGLTVPLTTRVSIRKIKADLADRAPSHIWARHLFNRLEGVVLPGYPALRDLKERLVSLGCAGVLMSGSGSSVFGVVSSRHQGQQVVRRLKRLGFQAWLVRTLQYSYGNQRDPHHTSTRPTSQSLCQRDV